MEASQGCAVPTVDIPLTHLSLAFPNVYPDDWLEEQNKREAQTKEWNGKQLNAYEQTQQQRKMETAMRAQRQKIRLLEEAGADKDDIMLEKSKVPGTAERV